MIKNNKRYIYFLLCILTLAFISVCKNGPLTKEYFPHKDGDQWKYKTTEQSGYFIREFSGTTRIDGTTFLNWIRTDFDTAGTQIYQETSYIIVTDSMVKFFEDTDADPYILLIFPLVEDSTWSFEIDEERIDVLVEGIENEIQVEAGTYDNVYVVRYNDPENEERRQVYYAPNVGIIKDIWFDFDDPAEPFLYDELIQYPASD